MRPLSLLTNLAIGAVNETPSFGGIWAYMYDPNFEWRIDPSVNFDHRQDRTASYRYTAAQFEDQPMLGYTYVYPSRDSYKQRNTG